MFKYKFIVLILLMAVMGTTVYAQSKLENPQIKTISGTVINVDAVGNVITVQVEDSAGDTATTQMSFSVPDKTHITQETHDIGLMDIRQGHPVTIQYFIPSPGKYTVSSIVDNAPVASE